MSKSKFALVALWATSLDASMLQCSLDMNGVPQAVLQTTDTCRAGFATIDVSASYGALNATGQSYTDSLWATASFDDVMTIAGGSGSAFIAFDVVNTCPTAAGNCVASFSGALAGSQAGWRFTQFSYGVPFGFGASLFNGDNLSRPPAMLGASVRIASMEVTASIQLMGFSFADFALPVTYSTESRTTYNFVNGVDPAPVPEPGAFWIALCGLAIIGVHRAYPISFGTKSPFPCHRLGPLRSRESQKSERTQPLR